MRQTIFLLFAFAFAIYVSSVELENEGIKVSAVGKSPKFKVFENNNKTSWYMVEMDDGITEVNEKGEKVSDISSFSSQAVEFSDVVVFTRNETKFYCFSYEGTLKNNAEINVTFCINDKNTTYEFGDDVVYVPEHSLKYTVDISKWPFKAQTNKLSFIVTIKLRSGEGNSEIEGETEEDGEDSEDGKESGKENGRRLVSRSGSGKDKDKDTDEKEKKVKFTLSGGEGRFVLLKYALVDGVKTNITTSVREKGTKIEFTFLYPYFSNSLVYDPVLGFSSSSNPEIAQPLNSGAIAGIAIAAVVVVVAVALVAFFVLKKK